MRTRHYFLSFLLILLLLDSGLFAAASPTISILYPTDGATLTTHQVNVTGVASGTEAQWFQTTNEDFQSGTMENVTSDGDGGIVLEKALYDDFNNGWDDSKWIHVDESGGITAKVADGRYEASGKGNTSGQFYSRCLSVSNDFFNGMISADLIEYPTNESADNYGGAFIGLFQDSTNYIVAGVANNHWFRGYSQLDEENDSGGHGVGMGALGGDGWTWPTPGSHNFRLEWNSTNLDVYVDDTLMRHGWYNGVNSNDSKIVLYTDAPLGSFVKAVWDNVTGNKIYSGNFTSSSYDTHLATPLLESVHWNQTLPNGTNVTVMIRSSDDQSMTNPTSLQILQNDQTTGFSPMKRYLQYRVSVYCTDGIQSPVFEDIAINYIDPIVKVEVSIDNRSTWLPVSGLENWNANLTLAENSNIIWVRAIDTAGEINYSFIHVNVDTTPPAGTIIINNGDRATRTPNVNLTLNATDLFGVAKMMVSEDLTFDATNWSDYQPNLEWTLSDGDGQKTIYAKFEDANGWESTVVSDSILLDTSPPSAELLINNGVWCTNSSRVHLRLNASDNDVVTMMEISEDPALAMAKLVPYQPEFDWSLSPSEGDHIIYARVWDSAQNPSAIVCATIILDLTPPKAYCGVPVSVPQCNFSLNYDVSDIHSGLAYDDIEYRDGNGSWTPWLTHVPFDHRPSPTLSFEGQDGHTYSFRIRAMDNAGNLGQFAEANNTVTVNVPPPLVNITDPIANEKVRGMLRVKGTALTASDYPVGQVLVKLDNGDWKLANITNRTEPWLLDMWMLDINTKALKNGLHAVRAKSYDGSKYSDEAVVPFTVDNKAIEPTISLENNMGWALLGVLILCCAVAWIANRAMNRKRNNGE